MQGEGGGTPPEKGTRLARAECNDSLEQGGREKCRERGGGGGEGEREKVKREECNASNGKMMHPRPTPVPVFFPTHPRCEHLFAVYEIEGTSDIEKRRHLGNTGNANKVHSLTVGSAPAAGV